MKVLVLQNLNIADMFVKQGWDLVNSMEGKPDLVVFTGGEDIGTSLYRHATYYKTGHPNRNRDDNEFNIFHECLALDIPMVGICRGAQLLCALSGGTLYQHVEGHTTSHYATTVAGEKIFVTSTHHQMMNPVRTQHKVLMSTPNQSKVYFEAVEVEPPRVDYEVVYFPRTRALAHQPHPEYLDAGARYPLWFFETVEQLMNKEF